MFNDESKAENSFTMAVPLKGIFGFYDYDKVLCGLKIRFQLQRNDNENRLFFGVASAFGDQNKFVIDEMSWYCCGFEKFRKHHKGFPQFRYFDKSMCS